MFSDRPNTPTAPDTPMASDTPMAPDTDICVPPQTKRIDVVAVVVVVSKHPKLLNGPEKRWSSLRANLAARWYLTLDYHYCLDSVEFL